MAKLDHKYGVEIDKMNNPEAQTTSNPLVHVIQVPLNTKR